MNIVDIHPHIVSNDVSRYPITPLGGKRSDWSHHRSVDAEQLLAAMDAAGVKKAAIVHSSTTYGFNCNYVADVIAKNKDRFAGVFSINVLLPDATETMKYWISRGMAGMRIFSRGSTIDEPWLALDDPRIFLCYELAAYSKIPVATNIKIENFDELESILKTFPETNFILDHLGGISFQDGAPFNNALPLWRLAKYENLYLKLVTGKFIDANKGKSSAHKKFTKIVEEFGANRCAWGSNYPSASGTLAEMLTIAKEGLKTLSKNDQEWIFGKTALKLYPSLS